MKGLEEDKKRKERMKEIRLKQMEKRLEAQAQFVSTEETREECRMILDYYLGDKFDGEVYHQHFIRWFDKGRKIDRYEAFEWIKENKDRFDGDMLKSAQYFYENEI